MLTFRPGRIRHQVNVYLPSTSVDDYGRRTGDDTLVYAAVPAFIEQLTALELIRARQVYPEATHRLQMIVFPGHGISSKHYLKFGDRTLHIGAVIDEQNIGVEIELLCKEEL